MKPLDKFNFKPAQCLVELDNLDILLSKKEELEERSDILPFFEANQNLAAYISSYSPGIVAANLLNLEYSLYADFTADLIVGDSQRDSYCLVEFEDAKKDSIFRSKGRTTTEWSNRFEHGYSQIVDWLWKIDDFKNTGQGRAIFGSDTFDFMGILVIGRDKFLSPQDRLRLKWRINKVVINSQKIVCLTFDQLARDLRASLDVYKTISTQKDS